jgi:hypothetical protein
VLGIVWFESIAVDASCSLEFGAKADGCGQFDDGGFILDGLRDFDGFFHGIDVMVTVFDVLGVPSMINTDYDGNTRRPRIVSRRLR